MKQYIFTLLLALGLMGCSESIIQELSLSKDETSADADATEEVSQEPVNGVPLDSIPEVTYDDPESLLKPLPRIEFTEAEAIANQQLNKFSFKLLNSIAANYDETIDAGQRGNMNLSPISATLCLSMVANSIDDDNRDKFVDVLGPNDYTSLNAVCNKLLRYLPCRETGAKLYLANSVWYRDMYTVTPDYINLMNNTFGAEINATNFSDADATIKMINDWCSLNTRGLIPSIIDEVDPQLSMILANAIYFNGRWDCKFNKANTKPATFCGTEGDSQVEMMTASYVTEYARTLNFDAIVLPFSGLQTRCILVLPRKTLDINDASTKLDYNEWLKLTDSFKAVDATMSVPKFRIEQGLQLNKVLSLLGMNLDQVSTHNIGIPSEQVLNIIQKSAITTDEEGIEAAAVTATMMCSSDLNAPEYEKVEITFDRPFMYFIENVKTGSILMAGRVANI